MTNPHDKLSRIRFLTISLFLSGCFNILLLALLCYWATQDKPATAFVQLKPKTETSSVLNEELLRHYRTLSFDGLIGKLQNTSNEERDLAVAALVAFYDFDIKRALCSSMHPLTSQVLICRSGEKLLTFPHLKEEQVQLILDFAKKERWPLKAKGLFSLLKQDKYRKDKSLSEAFYLSDEFVFVQNLLASSKHVSNMAILQILLEGPWELLASTYAKTRAISVDQRPHFLYEYVKNGSSLAASLLLKTDWEFVVNRLNDDSVMIVFKMLKDQDDLKKLSTAIATSPRGEALRRLAQDVIGTPALQEKMLTKLKTKEVRPHVKKLLPVESTYIVQEGDSLWKIARKYQIEVDDLKKFNSLSSDVLQPGSILRIPV